MVVTTSRSPRELFSENRVATLYAPPSAAATSAATATAADSNDFHICTRSHGRFFFRSAGALPGDGVSDTIYFYTAHTQIKGDFFSAAFRHLET